VTAWAHYPRPTPQCGGQRWRQLFPAGIEDIFYEHLPFLLALIRRTDNVWPLLKTTIVFCSPQHQLALAAPP
jgi:hypothetical protein